MRSKLSEIKQSLVQRRKLRKIKIDSVFIVSTGRTGTLFFETFFNEVLPYSYSVHEPKPDLFNISMDKLRNKMPSKEIINFIIENRSQLINDKKSSQKVKTYVECNPFMPLILDEVKAAFPKSKFIFIIRDAKTYVKSALNKSPNGDNKMFMYGESDHRVRMSALDYESDDYYSEWTGFNRVEKISWYWNKCNLLLLDFFKSNKDRTLLLSFEKLFSKSEDLKKKEISKISKFVGLKLKEADFERILPIFRDKKNNTNTVFHEGYNQWSGEDRAQFEKLTKEATVLIKRQVE